MQYHTQDGCWFYLAPGSGVSLNVTRTKVARSREALRAEWRLPQPNAPTNDAHFCRQAIRHGYGSIQFVGSNGPADTTANETSSGLHVIQTGWIHGQFRMPELVLCSGRCVTEESRTPCPGVPLLQTDGSPCECDEEFPLLRCRREPGQPPRVDPCPVQHDTHT